MAAYAPDVLADPVSVITGLIMEIERTLSRAAIADTVTGVAGGRAKRRRLAQALLDRPALLADGRSPAPRAAGDLLIALRAAGATDVAAPSCAGCGKPLRTMQRRGQDWYCGACGPEPEPCAACGSIRPVSSRDRDGRPRCGSCPPDSGQDPAGIVAGLVAAIDPALPASAVIAAVNAAAPQGRAAPAPGLGAAGPARAPHRGGSPGGGARGAAADRRPLRRGRGGRRPAALPALRPGDRPGQAH